MEMFRAIKVKMVRFMRKVDDQSNYDWEFITPSKENLHTARNYSYPVHRRLEEIPQSRP